MSLKQSAASGVKWTGLGTVFTALARFVQLAILTRLLDRQDFGLMAMVMVVIGFANAFADMGISQAIIHKQDATENQLSSLYWLNIVAGFMICILVWVTAPAVAIFYQEPRLIFLIRWASLVFILTPFGQQFQILLQKHLRFKPLTVIQIASRTVSLFVTVFLAWLGQGVFALVVGQIAYAFTNTLLLIGTSWSEWKPQLTINVGEIKDFLNFGLFQMGERSINYFAANIDYIIIGRFLGSEVLGLYSFAYELVLQPLKLINPAVTRVAFPIFAQRQTNNRALRYGYLEVVKLLLFVLSPVLMGIIVTAPVLVPVIFSSEWVPAIGLVQILAVVGYLKAIANPSGSILLAKGRADIGFWWNLGIVIVYAILFLSTVSYGALAVAWSYAIISVLFSFMTWLLLKNLINMSFKEYAQCIFRPTVLSTVMGIVTYGSYLLIKQSVLIPAVELMILVFIGTFIYSSLYIYFEKPYLLKLRQLLITRSVNPTLSS